ncbi:hypothetical protein HII17_13010 [Thalassotalea sp. M1531]|uniref:Lipoprotein n=1 Tax=Thalassotalea algicola TaxID=2716224 RepID=A0A7Y0LDC7_9GAMM|nr:hypothetical protein [Thalassotalea algicola]NMP32484.1 hypothetical protein [Thalassotalea algicola]
MNNLHKLSTTLLLISLLQACGGSSGASDDSNIPDDDQAYSIVINDQHLKIGKSIELVLYAPSANITNISWQQTDGLPLEITSPANKVLSVIADEAGDYTFSVSFNDNGNTQQLAASVTISDENALFTIPNGQSVLSESKVSLRAYAISGSIESIEWTQTSGPTISIENTDQALLIFDAPVVRNQDTVVTFEATAKTNGQTTTDTVTLLVESATQIPDNAYFDERVAKVFPYNADSPHASDLVHCVYSNTLSSSCKISQLPLLASETLNPTVDDIMNRVVVSHRWMGDNFKAFLINHDNHDDFKRLLRATTAVVISYDIRPSFYWAATGAIYLDANNFWLTPHQRDSINEEADYRSAFGKDLRFTIPWRYVRNNDYAFDYYEINQRQTRPLSAITYPLGYLLYHELAHANDFFPQQYWADVDENDRILDAAFRQAPISEQLSIIHPLNSQILKDLAQVRYAGTEATSLEKSYLPEDISLLFAPDGGVHFYSFRTEREDYAMLFEELMMQFRFGIYRDVAVTNNPAHQEDQINDYIVDWGQRGRLAEPQIIDRLRFASENVLPEFDVNHAIEQLPASLAMIKGLSWSNNLLLNSKSKRTSADHKINQNKEVPQPYIYYSKPLPKH